MTRSTTAVSLLLCGLVAGPAYSQGTANPTQQVNTASTDQVPVFRVTVVGRTTPAINYRPRTGETRVDFDGTPLMPRSSGQATVEGKKGYIEVDANFKNLGAPSKFGPEYLTYVVWAITPEGRSTNLGELQVNGDDGKLKVTTELQAFGMVVTAEPYFAVTQPSDVVVMENVVRDDTVGRIQTIEAKYELLQRGSYLMNGDRGQLSDKKIKPLNPGVRLDLAEARNAVALARLAGADEHATDTYRKASQLLANAELANERHRNGDEVMMPARQAVQTAEDARLIALQRQEALSVAAQRTALLQREAAALARARDEERRRQLLESEKIAAEAQRAAAERDRLTASQALAQAERDKAAAERERASAEAARVNAEQGRFSAEQARRAAESQAQQAQNQAQLAQAAAAQADREKAELRDRIREQLDVILETRETARGLIVNLSDVLFDTGSATLKPGAREKVAKIAGVLLAYPGLSIEIEGHTDSVGNEDYNQQLSERRAETVRSYLVRQGIPTTSVTAVGLGENQPVVSNDTASGRQQNRRVELVVSGESIAVTGTARRFR
jgi:outer membrane protein OmpA-like peptidoglycan-associated protein